LKYGVITFNHKRNNKLTLYLAIDTLYVASYLLRPVMITCQEMFENIGLVLTTVAAVTCVQ